MTLRTLIAAACCFTAAHVSGSVCTTLAPGDFFDPANWSCACVPSSCDTLLIEHVMTLDEPAALEHDFVRIGSSGQLVSTADLELRGELVVLGRLEAVRLLTNMPGGMTNSGEVVAQSYLALKAPYTNSGSVMTEDSLWIYSLGDLNNTGTINGGTVGVGPFCINYDQINAQYFTTGLLLNYGMAYVDSADLRTSLLYNNGTFHAQRIYGGNDIQNEAAGVLTCDRLYQEGLLGNYGVLRVFGTFWNGSDTTQGDTQLFDGSSTEVRNFINVEGSILRGPGTLCIAEHSENHGAVSGPVGICDVTPGSSTAPFMDVHTGVLALPVYECPNSPCATVGLAARTGPEVVRLFPQPASGQLTVELGTQHTSVSALLLHTITGQVVLRAPGPFGVQATLSTQAIPPGSYVLVGVDVQGHPTFSVPVLLD